MRGANINAKNHDGTTPLHEAVESGHIKMVKFLITYEGYLFQKANPNIVNKKSETPLFADSTKAIVKELILIGAHTDTRNEEGRTAAEVNPQATPLIKNFSERSASDIAETETIFLI